MKLALVLTTLSLMACGVSGCGKDTLPGGNPSSAGGSTDASGTGGAGGAGSGDSSPSPSACAASDCKDQPISAIGCADGSGPAYTCERVAGGACHWSSPHCPGSPDAGTINPPTMSDAAASDTTPSPGPTCGPKTCPAGEYCCNSSCGICAPKGAACIQIACDQKPDAGVPEAGVNPGERCGSQTCGSGEVCCSPTCGICTRKGAPCPAIACGTKLGPGVFGTCQTDSDCRLFDDYCTGCACRALSKSEKDPVCPGPGVRCFAEPCAMKKVACMFGVCAVAR